MPWYLGGGRPRARRIVVLLVILVSLILNTITISNTRIGSISY